MNCLCGFCAQLGAFLADPANPSTKISAREDHRNHLEHEIFRHEYDVTHTLERRGSPYSLILTKTTGSFERAVKRYQLNLKLLQSLPQADT